MKEVTHYQKVMWGLYCDYSYIPEKRWFVWRKRTRWNSETKTYDFVGDYKEWKNRRSNEQWDFIHSKHYYITKVHPVYSGSLNDFREHLENGKRSPYNYKKNAWHFKHSHRCGKRSYRWRWTRGERTKEQKKPDHVVKKTLTEEETRKREWKKEKNDPRDQGRRFCTGSHRKIACKHGNRAERRRTKQDIHRSDWDNMLSRKPQEWVNPWDWS